MLRSRVTEALYAASRVSHPEKPPSAVELTSWYPGTQLSSGICNWWQHGTLTSADGSAQGRIPVSLCVPATSNASSSNAAIIQLHATGRDRRQVAHRLEQYASAGIIGVSMDCRYHGARVDDSWRICWDRVDGYADALSQAWQQNDCQKRPFLMSSAMDVLQVVSWLKHGHDRDGTRAARVGLGGISLGGMITMLAGTHEDVDFAVPEIGVQSFAYALDTAQFQARAYSLPGDVFQRAMRDETGDPEAALKAHVVEKVYDVIAPGLVREFDGPAVLQLIADSKPLLALNGSDDPRCPVPGVQQCADAAKAAHAQEQANAPLPRFLVQQDVPHKCTQEMEDLAQAYLIRVAQGDPDGADSLACEAATAGEGKSHSFTML